MKKIYDKLPNEIIIKILNNINNTEDLINIYECFRKFKILMDNEIYIYLNIKEETRKYHFLNRHFYEIVNVLDLYIIEYNFIYKYDKKWFKEIWNKHFIFQKVIKLILNCNTCEYIYDNDKHRNIYECINCEKKVCEKCCFSDYHCFPYEYTNDDCHHCLECKDKCFTKIIKKFEKKYTTNEINYLKNITFKIYTKFIDINNIYGIEDTDFDKKIKYFLKEHFSDLKYYIINNKNINTNIRKNNIMSKFDIHEKPLIKKKMDNFSVLYN
jgi:hypothetical protein